MDWGPIPWKYPMPFALIEKRPDLAPSQDSMLAARVSQERIKIGNVAREPGKWPRFCVNVATIAVF